LKIHLRTQILSSKTVSQIDGNLTQQTKSGIVDCVFLSINLAKTECYMDVPKEETEEERSSVLAPAPPARPETLSMGMGCSRAPPDS
jgi:hypothetical protein